MLVEGEKKVNNFEKTVACLQAAIVENADSVLNPKGSHQQVRNRDILLTYCFSDASLRDLKDIYGVSRIRTSQIIAREMKFIWNNCSPGIQQLFPFCELSLGKPLAAHWQKLSQSRGGIALEILHRLQAGYSLHDIWQSGVSGDKLAVYRRVLGRHDIDIGYLKTPPKENIELAFSLGKPADDGRIQELLDKVNRNFYQNNVGGIITNVGFIATKCGFHYPGPKKAQFIQAIKDAGIPLGIVEFIETAKDESGKAAVHRYYFVASLHKERVRGVLEGDPNLQKFLENPVKQVFGQPVSPGEKLPTTWQLMGDKFKSTGTLRRKLGFHTGGFSKITNADLFKDGCPVTLYCRKNSYFYRTEDENILESFVSQRLLELGIT